MCGHGAICDQNSGTSSTPSAKNRSLWSMLASLALKFSFLQSRCRRHADALRQIFVLASAAIGGPIGTSVVNEISSLGLTVILQRR